MCRHSHSHEIRPLLLSLCVGLALVGLLLLGLGRSAADGPEATSLFVTASGGSTSCSQAQPCALMVALAHAEDGDTIYMSAGTYTGTHDEVLLIEHSITVRGGWDGTTTRPPVCNRLAHPTIVDGQLQRRGVRIAPETTVTLQGFTVTNGVHPEKGAGLYALDADVTLRAMTFDRNLIEDTWADRPYGGGAALERGRALVIDSAFTGNSVWGQITSIGGGLIISATLEASLEQCLFQGNDSWNESGLYISGTGSSSVVIRGCRILDNGWGFGAGSSSGGYRSGMGVSNARARVEDNLVSHNFAANGWGAVYVSGRSLELHRNMIMDNTSNYDPSGLVLSYVEDFAATNNIIANNESTYINRPDAAVEIRSGSGQFMHNTIASNDNEFGLRVRDRATVSLTNTIIVNHSVGISVEADSTAHLNGTLWGAGDWANDDEWSGDGTVTMGTLNVRQPPGFRAAQHGDYHLAAGSAAIDRGLDVGVIDDVDGDDRPLGAAPDIGADEWVSGAPTPTRTPTPTLTPTAMPRATSTPTRASRRLYLPLTVRPR